MLFAAFPLSPQMRIIFIGFFFFKNNFCAAFLPNNVDNCAVVIRFRSCFSQTLGSCAMTILLLIITLICRHFIIGSNPEVRLILVLNFANPSKEERNCLLSGKLT